jgi:uncharacterized membrane protein YidH (DUF202 family)
MLNKIHKAAWYRALPKSAVVLVIIAVVNLVVMLVRGYMAELAMRDSEFTISHWSPYRTESYWLVIAAICLLSNRFWMLLISMLISGWVLYDLSYARWRWLARNVYDLPILNWLTTEKILRNYLERPEIVVELILATSILITGLVLLCRLRLRRKD